MIARHPNVVLMMAVGLAALALACSKTDGGGSGTPSSPSTGLAGTWRGTASDSSGPGEMTWTITQNGGSFSGTITMSDTATRISGRGSIAGTITGANLHYTITVGTGGFDPPYASCTAEATGDGQLSGTSITGDYAGSNSCAGSIASGQLSLTKQ